MKDGIENAPVASGGGTEVKSPLPGAVLKIVAAVGDTVNEGDTLITIEAMKMETEIKASTSGTVSQIYVSVGDQVSADQVIVSIN